MLELRLHLGLAGARRVRLRALAGGDELNADPGDPASFCDFVDRLVVERDSGYLRPGQARQLAVCELESVAVALQRRCYGERIESSLTCRECGRAFDLSFELADLLHNRAKHRAGEEIAGPDERGVFTLRDGRQFRLPTGADQLAVAHLDSDHAAAELRSRCVVQGDFEMDPEAVEAAMEAAGPLLPQEIEAVCPHCQRPQTAQFQLPRFFLDALASERRFLNHEIHHLARGYGWSRAEILEMTREDRRLHVRLVLP